MVKDHSCHQNEAVQPLNLSLNPNTFCSLYLDPTLRLNLGLNPRVKSARVKSARVNPNQGLNLPQPHGASTFPKAVPNYSFSCYFRGDF